MEILLLFDGALECWYRERQEDGSLRPDCIVWRLTGPGVRMPTEVDLLYPPHDVPRGARVAAGEVESVSLGRLLSGHADGLGLQPDEHEMRFSAGTVHYGAQHWRLRHADTLPQAAGLRCETLWQPGSEARIVVHGGAIRMLLWNRPTNHVGTFVRKGRQWELQTIDVWNPTEGFRKARMLE